MVAILAPLDKTRTYTPVWLRAVFTSERGLARRQYQRLRVNDLSSLYPESQMREVTLRFAKQFVADMAKQGFELLSNEADVLVTGPFRSRGWHKASDGTVQVKHHVARANKDVGLLPTFSRSGQQELFPEKEDFLLEAQFLGTRTVMVEHPIRADLDG